MLADFKCRDFTPTFGPRIWLRGCLSRLSSGQNAPMWFTHAKPRNAQEAMKAKTPLAAPGHNSASTIAAAPVSALRQGTNGQAVLDGSEQGDASRRRGAKTRSCRPQGNKGLVVHEFQR